MMHKKIVKKIKIIYIKYYVGFFFGQLEILRALDMWIDVNYGFTGIHIIIFFKAIVYINSVRTA